ncbi:MAG: hypothetical protein VCE75_10460 [Alphaproteobacteria bacterium]
MTSPSKYLSANIRPKGRTDFLGTFPGAARRSARLTRLAKHLWVNIYFDANGFSSRAFEAQRDAAQAVNDAYVSSIYSMRCPTGRNLGHCDLRDLYDADDQVVS